MAKKRKRSRGKRKEAVKSVLLPVSGFILAVFLLFGSYTAAQNVGISFPSIGIPTWITGSTGSSGSSTVGAISSWNGQEWVIVNGGVTLIPPGVIASKMSLVASFTDNTNETIFENSTLPGTAFALIPTIHGKQVRSMTALAAVAVLQPSGQNLPEGAKADFRMNFTAYITQLSRAKWSYVERIVPFMNNGSIAMAVPPAFTILPAEVFPDSPTGTGSRQVAWNLHVEVTITAPNRESLTLIPVNDISSANWDFSGALSGGCTDCGGNSAPMSGVKIDEKTGTVSVSNPTATSSTSPGSNPPPPTVPHSETATAAPQVASVSLGCTATSCTSITTTHDPKTGTQKQTTTTKDVQTVTTTGSHTYASSPTGTNGGIAGTAIRPGQNGVLLHELPYPTFGLIEWGRVTLGGTVYLVNPLSILVILIVAFSVAISVYVVYKRLQKKRRK
jgi:hypothetical protein